MANERVRSHSAAMPPPDLLSRAVVVGSTGGIGTALVEELTNRGIAVTCLARSPQRPGDIPIDIVDPTSVQAAADKLKESAPYSCIIVATGLLHGEGVAPEKSVRDLEPAQMMRYFAVNAIGPVIVARHFQSLLPRSDRSVFAVLSARVGSIGDNRLGGWYGYRASKAALNMLIKSLAIEWGRSRPDLICIGLHPGTVDTGLSRPFQANVPPANLFSPAQAARSLIDVIEGLSAADTGSCFAWDGQRIEP